MPGKTFFIKLLTKPDQLVLDPFGGTGTTALAAEQLERRWLVTEIDPKYAAIVPQRFEALRVSPMAGWLDRVS